MSTVVCTVYSIQCTPSTRLSNVCKPPRVCAQIKPTQSFNRVNVVVVNVVARIALSFLFHAKSKRSPKVGPILATLSQLCRERTRKLVILFLSEMGQQHLLNLLLPKCHFIVTRLNGCATGGHLFASAAGSDPALNPDPPFG